MDEVIRRKIENGVLEDTSIFKNIKLFHRTGKQGELGLLSINNGEEDEEVVFKISLVFDFIIDHEFYVMKGLSQLEPYCPHFSRLISKFRCKVSKNFRKTKNPFDIKNGFIWNDVLLMENVTVSVDDKTPARKFRRYIENTDLPDKIIYSIIKQVLIAIQIAQEKKKFVHYDLHSNNILIRRCDEDIVFTYFLKGRTYFVPTYGYYPVIIDFGFSHIDDLNGKPLSCSLSQTDIGFLTQGFDYLADYKLFLITVSEEMEHERSGITSETFRSIVYNVFEGLEVDWSSGWDISKVDISATDMVISHLMTVEEKSFFVDSNKFYLCVDILENLCFLPLKEQSYENIGGVYKNVVLELMKIEDQISNKYSLLYILRGIVEIARSLRTAYFEDREKTVLDFSRKIFELIQPVAKFCNLKQMNYERLLKNLLKLGLCIEGVCYEATKMVMDEKEKDYKKLKVNDLHKMFDIIDMNIRSFYDVSKKTTIYLFNAENESFKIIRDLPQTTIDKINDESYSQRSKLCRELF